MASLSSGVVRVEMTVEIPPEEVAKYLPPLAQSGHRLTIASGPNGVTAKMNLMGLDLADFNEQLAQLRAMLDA